MTLKKTFEIYQFSFTSKNRDTFNLKPTALKLSLMES